MTEKKKYFYQPDITTAIIAWCWTFLILIIGVVIWLEVTTFNWITAVFLLVFVVISALAIFRRTMIVTEDRLILNRVLQQDYAEIPLSAIKHLYFRKNTAVFTAHGEVMTFSMSRRSIRSLETLLNNLMAKSKEA